MFESLSYNLKYNRKKLMRRASGLFIFGLIIVVMGFWGIQKGQQQQGFSAGTAATVNGEMIPAARLQEAVERLRRDPRMQQYEALGGEFGQKMLQSQALSQIVEMELVRQKAEREHIITTDAEVRDTITAIPAFQENGQFKREIYNNYLAQTGKTGAEFEAEIRQEQALRRTVELFRSSLAPTPLEVAREQDLGNTKTDVEFLKIPTETVVFPASINRTEVESFLADAKNEKRVKDYYEAHKKEYSNDEQVRARHILIKTVEGDKDSENKAFAKAQDIEKKLKAGGNFAALAKESSDDPGSKDKGGELGFFSKGQMVPGFEDAAFNAKVGAVTEPVKTQFGYHIIQVEEKKPAATRDYDAAKFEIAENMLAKEKSQKAISDLEAALKTPQASSAVATFANDHKLKWEDSGIFTLQSESVPKIGESDDALQEAFTLTPEKPLGQKLVRQGSFAYVLRYKPVSADKDKKPNPNDNPEMLAAFAANRRSEDALRGWVESIRKNSKIVTSDGVGASGPVGGSPFDDE